MPLAATGVTVAVNVTLVPKFTLVADGDSEIEVGVFFMTCAKLLASMEPSPVTWS